MNTPSLSTDKAWQILLWVWIAFTTFYTLTSFAYPYVAATSINSAKQAGYLQGANEATQQALQSFSGNVFQNGQTAGQQATVMQLVQELSKQYETGCKDVVPVNVGTGSIGILSANCLQVLSNTNAQKETNK